MPLAPARKLFVASVGVAAISFGCSNNGRTVGNGMTAFVVDSGPIPDVLVDTTPETSTFDSGGEASADVGGDATGDSDTLDAGADTKGE